MNVLTAVSNIFDNTETFWQVKYIWHQIIESSKNNGRSNIFELSKNIGRSRRRGGESETDESSLPQIPLFRISQPLNLLHLDICSFPDIPALS